MSDDCANKAAQRVGERVHRDMYCLGYWQHDDDHRDGGWVVTLDGRGYLSHPDIGYLLGQTAVLRADSPDARFFVCRIVTTIERELGADDDVR